MRHVNKYNLLFLQILIIILFTAVAVSAASYEEPVLAVGDITRIKGVRENQLFGFGLVIGLNGTGDSNRYQPTILAHSNMLSHLGINVTPDQINSRNVAAVMVTATLTPFTYVGDSIDITVSSLGDATSLQGGVLFITALQAANGEIYAVAQGPVSIGGYNYRAAGSQVQQNHPTVAIIPNGAIVEKEIEFQLGNEELVFYLDSPNFETARNIALAINSYFDVLFAEEKLAQAIDAGQIRVKVPKQYKDDVVDYIAKINGLQVRPGLEAKVVINERTGTIVMGHNVKISTVSVAHGNLTVTIRAGQEVSQPPSFSRGETVVLEETVMEVVEEEGSLTVLPTNSTVEELVFALNTLGASPRDIIAILQLIDAQGALHARLELR